MVDEKIHKIKDLLADGFGVSAIKKVLPMVSVELICEVRQGLGLSRRPAKTVKQDEQIRKLCLAGLTALEIATKLEKKESVVYKSLRRQGLKAKKKAKNTNVNAKEKRKPGPKPNPNKDIAVTMRLPADVVMFLRNKGPTLSLATRNFVAASPDFLQWKESQ